MASDEKRSALDDLYAATQALTFLHHVEHHSGEGGSWWKQGCCSSHHEMILKAGEELRALRAENARLRDALLSFTEAGCPCSDCTRARAALGGRDE